jgi:hypothetical protein
MWRVYFVIGDILACTLTGAAAAWLAHTTVSADWFMAVGILVGMGLGMLAGVIGGLLFTPLFGAMEVMLPASLSSIVAGVGAGMAQTISTGGILLSEALLGGALAGLVCLAYTYLLQAKLHGEVKHREPN